MTQFDELVLLTSQITPRVALVLGSGMGELVKRVLIRARVPFLEVPGLQATSVTGHQGYLTLADWSEKRVLIFEGRLHFYEGHSWDCVVEPVRIAHRLGARALLLTNAAGGIDPTLRPGSLMALTAHIEWTRPYCWRESPRPSPYAPRLLSLLHRAANELGIPLHDGVYAQVTGPCYETPAEVRALRAWGASAVGMSTAREAQTAYELGMECGAVSCIANSAAGVGGGPITHAEVLTNVAAASVRLFDLLQNCLQLLEA